MKWHPWDSSCKTGEKQQNQEPGGVIWEWECIREVSNTWLFRWLVKVELAKLWDFLWNSLRNSRWWVWHLSKNGRKSKRMPWQSDLTRWYYNGFTTVGWFPISLEIVAWTDWNHGAPPLPFPRNSSPSLSHFFQISHVRKRYLTLGWDLFIFEADIKILVIFFTLYCFDVAERVFSVCSWNQVSGPTGWTWWKDCYDWTISAESEAAHHGEKQILGVTWYTKGPPVCLPGTFPHSYVESGPVGRPCLYPKQSWGCLELFPPHGPQLHL